MAIPQTFIQDLLARADIVDIIGRYVTLKKGGANFMGLCPFHGEKSPSFSVSPTKQFYHCFGCGKNGNAIGFLMEHAGMGFVEAVTDLAQQYGMPMPEDEASPQDRARAKEIRDRQHTLHSVLEKAGEAYRKHLKESPRAIDYFKGRGVSGEIARQFGLGYAPPGWNNLASVFPDYNDALLVESGLVIHQAEEKDEAEESHEKREKRYDRFRDRVMFPIRNVKGELIGFGGRVLSDEKPKYLNSPETPVFSKGRELYGLFEARTAIRSQGFALVTEGYMDVVALAQLGYPNTVATLGTACTADHVQKLFRFTDSVVFSFDGDAAGRRAARKALDAALPFATDLRQVKFLFLPTEHDPDSFIRAHGQEAFSQYIKSATPLSRFLIDSASEGCDLDTAEGRAQLSSHARPLWSAIPEGALKIQLLGELADRIHLSGRELSQLWSGANQNGRERAAVSNASGASGGNVENGADPSAWRDAGWRPSPQRQIASRPNRPNRQNHPNHPSRARPSSRADHATRILLGHTELWQTLGREDHTLLCELPPPHGTLLSWLEAHLHDHGPQPPKAILEALEAEDHPLKSLAESLTDTPRDGPEDNPTPLQEVQDELRDVLNRMLIDQLKWQETEAIAASAIDPAALLRYRELQARRLHLEKLQQEKIQTGGIIHAPIGKSDSNTSGPGQL